MAVLALSVSWCVGGRENETCFPCTDRTSRSHAATRLHAAFRQGAALRVLPSMARGHPGQQLALPGQPSTEGAESLPTREKGPCPTSARAGKSKSGPC